MFIIYTWHVYTLLHYVTPCDTACENSTNVSIQYHDDHELQIAFSQNFLHFFGVFLMLKVTLVMFGPNMSKLKGKLEWLDGKDIERLCDLQAILNGEGRFVP